MTTAPPNQAGPRSFSPNPPPRPQPPGHTELMAIRIGVQADSEEECVEGLAQLVDRGYIPIMLPKFLTDGRWMARAVPAPPPAAVGPGPQT